MTQAQTQDEQEQELQKFQSYLTPFTTLTAGRCDHETCDRTSIWVFQTRQGGKKQIASVTRNLETTSDYKWICQKMMNSNPVTNLSFKTLEECYGYVIDCCWKGQ